MENATEHQTNSVSIDHDYVSHVPHFDHTYFDRSAVSSDIDMDCPKPKAQLDLNISSQIGNNSNSTLHVPLNNTKMMIMIYSYFPFQVIYLGLAQMYTKRSMYLVMVIAFSTALLYP